ncbi:MAG TPA: tetratricopeptide repeat protein [Candidatus Saccharimonadales bacterium]|nr:tetratricopeptide repeat protein [Candidatus Saccharimonadales bacterium]
MSLRFLWCLVCAFVLLALSGCEKVAETKADEQKNPHFMVGKDRVASKDYSGAIEAFERAIEVNPRSALAHFELGLLYEQHDESDNHLISAMYHYKKALDLRPNAYPAENARMRMAGCKQELVKSESLAPVYQTMQRDLERLKDENQLLKRQVESWQAQSSPRSNSQSGNTPLLPNPILTRQTPSPGNQIGPAKVQPPPYAVGGVTPLPPGPTGGSRTYTVQAGDTFAAIARKQKINLEKLQAANPAVTPKKLRQGQTLILPSN